MPKKNNPIHLESFIADEPQPNLMTGEGLELSGSEIAKRSHEYIDRVLMGEDLDNNTRAIIRRIIHATADFSFARSVKIHPRAIEQGLKALSEFKPVICDVNMVKAGITSIENELICEIKSGDVLESAKKNHTTRAAAAIEKLQDKLDGSIVVVGNAPTALFKIMELARKNSIQPALVIGLPVGFVGARESKLALIKSGLAYITNTSCKGGSPVAAAAMNALANLGEKEHVH